jgi:hypothetical protein
MVPSISCVCSVGHLALASLPLPAAPPRLTFPETAALPELIAQTNMDQQSVNRLRDELGKFTNWLEKHIPEYFVNTYESPTADYADKIKH